ncbi:MAG: hypothetical protein L0G59_08090 [Kocuria sp.]|nr:hypothetical protein [Kocuria sp.]MDN5617855.1 hypothetical protein [Kocuria sp.]
MNPVIPQDIDSVDDLRRHVLLHERSASEPLIARSVFYVQHGTRLATGDQLYRNQYVLVRVENAFGACAVEAGELGPEVSELSGRPVGELLEDSRSPVRLAALDGWLAARCPHRDDDRAQAVRLPPGTPDQRAEARDDAVAGLLDIGAGDRVALIGVVNPLVAAIRDRGGEPLPCDFGMQFTQWGDPVTDDMDEVLDEADAVIATGMTLGNGSFDRIRRRCLDRSLPLALYAQSGSAVAREFLGRGVAALSAEHFPFSQFSADETLLHVYRVP